LRSQVIDVLSEHRKVLELARPSDNKYQSLVNFLDQWWDSSPTERDRLSNPAIQGLSALLKDAKILATKTGNPDLVYTIGQGYQLAPAPSGLVMVGIGQPVWKTFQDAAPHAVPGWLVYGMLAKWEVDTCAHTSLPWHILARSRQAVCVDGAGRCVTDLTKYIIK